MLFDKSDNIFNNKFMFAENLILLRIARSTISTFSFLTKVVCIKVNFRSVMMNIQLDSAVTAFLSRKQTQTVFLGGLFVLWFYSPVNTLRSCQAGQLTIHTVPGLHKRITNT